MDEFVGSIDQRVSRLERQKDEELNDIEARRKDIDKRLQELNANIEALRAEVIKYKGFIGGISLAVSIIWAGLVFFKETIVKFLTH